MTAPAARRRAHGLAVTLLGLTVVLLASSLVISADFHAANRASG